LSLDEALVVVLSLVLVLALVVVHPLKAHSVALCLV
jgi:hypothetical protein